MAIPQEVVRVGDVVRPGLVPVGATVRRLDRDSLYCWEVVELPEKRYRLGDPVTSDDIEAFPAETVIMAPGMNAAQRDGEDRWSETGFSHFRSDEFIREIVHTENGEQHWIIVWLPNGYEQRETD